MKINTEYLCREVLKYQCWSNCSTLLVRDTRPTMSLVLCLRCFQLLREIQTCYDYICIQMKLGHTTTWIGILDHCSSRKCAYNQMFLCLPSLYPSSVLENPSFAWTTDWLAFSLIQCLVCYHCHSTARLFASRHLLPHLISFIYILLGLPVMLHLHTDSRTR